MHNLYSKCKHLFNYDYILCRVRKHYYQCVKKVSDKNKDFSPTSLDTFYYDTT